MIDTRTYTTFEYERGLGNAMRTDGFALYREDEYKRDVRSRFADERMSDLRDGAADMGIKGRTRMSREQLLDAIADWRWSHLPAMHKI